MKILVIKEKKTSKPVLPKILIIWLACLVRLWLINQRLKVQRLLKFKQIRFHLREKLLSTNIRMINDVSITAPRNPRYHYAHPPVSCYVLQLTSQILTTGEEDPWYQTWTSNETLAWRRHSPFMYLF